MSDFTDLVSFKKDRDKRTTESVYYVQHSSSFVRIIGKNSKSTIDQELVITGDLSYRTYKAQMEMKGMPNYHSEREAALKLAEWFQRMGAAIENHWSLP